ncbi:hypothetical protein BH10ACI3_BH10ACI3_06830 [soil metagenome]
MASEIQTNSSGILGWLSRETEIDAIKYRLLDDPASGAAAWLRTTSGMIVILLLTQFLTGLLLAFHYVPSTASAYITVAFIELAVRDGAWIRSLHYHSSVLLPIVLVLHLLQMIGRSAFKSNATAWTFGLVLLGLVLGAGATGYALPWDARAINGVNIASSLAGNAPFIGETAKAWLISGSAISTLTLSRFYGLHVWIVPLLILLSIAARLFIFGKRSDDRDREQLSNWATQQFARNAVVIGLVFLGLALFSGAYPAPFGPQPSADTAAYLPRPGPQFLWLFEMQKYTDGALAATLALGFPGMIIGGLVALPILLRNKLGSLKVAIPAIFVFGFSVVGILTATAIYQDTSDAKISEQLAKQEKDEAAFRASTFEPQIQHAERPVKPDEKPASDGSPEVASSGSEHGIPETYTVNCSKCHGASGEGTKKFPELTGVTTREEDQLSPDMVLKIIDDPKAVGRGSKMPAYKNKLNDAEKQEIVAWIRTLAPKPDEGGTDVVQTARVDRSN